MEDTSMPGNTSRLYALISHHLFERAQSDISRRDTVKAPGQLHVFSGSVSVEEASASYGTDEFEGMHHIPTQNAFGVMSSSDLP